jgi:hypothetical protein
VRFASSLLTRTVVFNMDEYIEGARGAKDARGVRPHGHSVLSYVHAPATDLEHAKPSLK